MTGPPGWWKTDANTRNDRGQHDAHVPMHPRVRCALVPRRARPALRGPSV